MIKPTLVIMAAGMGSRYGGLKQLDPVGPNGEVIIDYSIYDALRAGFGKVVFIIREDMKQAFHEAIGHRIERFNEVDYVFQRLNDMPSGFIMPEGRTKPWGTAQAVLSCRDAVHTPFAVINADDFYGPSTYKIMYDYLIDARDGKDFYNYSMVGFMIENTLTDNGYVARGVCTLDDEGYLKEIHERTQIKRFKNSIKYMENDGTCLEIPEGSTVSMNVWGFTPSIFSEIENKFPKFLERNKDGLLKAEYFLPDVVDSLIKDGKARVKVLTSKEQWYGVTYREDKPHIVNAIRKLIENGVYPENLWGDKNE